jgi:hypothetical protein
MRTVHNDLLIVFLHLLANLYICFTIITRRSAPFLRPASSDQASTMAWLSSFPLLLLIVSICAAIADADPMRERFEQWMSRHGRLYGEADEKQRRLEVYRRNVELIEAFNSMSSGYKLTDNKFADLTNQEFRAKMLGFGPQSRTVHTPTSSTMTCVCFLLL